MKKHPKKWCLYRTQWHMAHNILHALEHGKRRSVHKAWKDYAKELKTADEIACTPA